MKLLAEPCMMVKTFTSVLQLLLQSMSLVVKNKDHELRSSNRSLFKSVGNSLDNGKIYINESGIVGLKYIL